MEVFDYYCLFGECACRNVIEFSVVSFKSRCSSDPFKLEDLHNSELVNSVCIEGLALL